MSSPRTVSNPTPTILVGRPQTPEPFLRQLGASSCCQLTQRSYTPADAIHCLETLSSQLQLKLFQYPAEFGEGGRHRSKPRSHIPVDTTLHLKTFSSQLKSVLEFSQSPPVSTGYWSPKDPAVSHLWLILSRHSPNGHSRKDISSSVPMLERCAFKVATMSFRIGSTNRWSRARNGWRTIRLHLAFLLPLSKLVLQRMSGQPFWLTSVASSRALRHSLNQVPVPARPLLTILRPPILSRETIVLSLPLPEHLSNPSHHPWQQGPTASTYP